MKEFVAYIVKNLVDNPDKVKINEIGGTQTLIIELSVEKSDIGKIIGKRGSQGAGKRENRSLIDFISAGDSRHASESHAGHYRIQHAGNTNDILYCHSWRCRFGCGPGAFRHIAKFCRWRHDSAFQTISSWRFH